MSEPLYVVDDFYDGPRAGYAGFEGKPHRFECRFDNDADEWTDICELVEVRPEVVALAFEQQATFDRWKLAQPLPFDGSHITALPEDRDRYVEIAAALTLLRPHLSVTPIVRRAEFRPASDTPPREWVVT